jgi:DNA-binding transcriptional MerR regulator
MSDLGVGTRTYLSIGDVLSLLREEFPDVTISKIRFLESQGLVNPERSPSGYRKFYDHDVERLRWVLRQQRENFLPLKVIRDRLAQEGGDLPPETSAEGSVAPATAQATQVAQVAPVAASAGAATGVLGARPLAEPAHGKGAANGEGVAHANGGLRTPRTEEPAIARAAGVAGATAPTGAPPSHGGREQQPSAGHAAGATSGPAAVGEVVMAGEGSRLQRPERTAQGSERPAAPAPAVPAADQPPRPSPRREATPPAHDEPSGSATAHTGAAGPGGPSGAAGQGGGSGHTGDAGIGSRAGAPPAMSGTNLTIEELCAASGLSVTEVASLEGFGLVAPVAVAGILYYDEEALVVAKLVASYRRYGIEPRHLRLYRNAVDREMGLVEQIVTPLLRQRNPEARQRASDAAAELAKLGQQLRSALLRREIRRQLGD